MLGMWLSWELVVGREAWLFNGIQQPQDILKKYNLACLQYTEKGIIGHVSPQSSPLAWPSQ